LKRIPDGEFVSEYLVNDTLPPGKFIVPRKYNPTYTEDFRELKYKHYLRRGLPIPQEFLPKEEDELLIKQRFYNEVMSGKLKSRSEESTPETDEATLGPPTKLTGLVAKSQTGTASGST